MPVILDTFNTLYVGGNKGRKFEIRFCPTATAALPNAFWKPENGTEKKLLRY